MAKYIFPNIGEINTENLESYYEGTIKIDDRKFRIDLNFDESQIDVTKLDAASKIVTDVEDYDKKNKQYIEADYRDKQGEAVREYLEHHLQEIDPEDLSDIVDPNQDASSKEEQLIKALHLTRIGLYPENEDQFAVFDYTIGVELTQYLIVVNLKRDGSFGTIEMES